jgi:LytS/YehU family sensor histidine kinase
MGFSFYTILVLIYYLSIYYQNLQDKTVREASLQASVKEAELNVLKSQLNPHFIFNSLNSISSLTMTAPEKAQDMVIKLSEFLRYSLHQKQNRITTLKDELQSLKLYLDIEKIRFGERLCLQENIPEDCLQQQLPHMLLQPIFENAIKHGVYESTEPVLITVDGACEPALLTLKISNTYDPEAVGRKGEGVGLNNVKNRLRLVYGGGELLKIYHTDHIFTVTLLIPQNHADKSTDH